MPLSVPSYSCTVNLVLGTSSLRSPVTQTDGASLSNWSQRKVIFFPTSLQRNHYQSHYKYASYQIFLRVYTLYLIVY